jgi:hypothetical protein
VRVVMKCSVCATEQLNECSGDAFTTHCPSCDCDDDEKRKKAGSHEHPPSLPSLRFLQVVTGVWDTASPSLRFLQVVTGVWDTASAGMAAVDNDTTSSTHRARNMIGEKQTRRTRCVIEQKKSNCQTCPVVDVCVCVCLCVGGGGVGWGCLTCPTAA